MKDFHAEERAINDIACSIRAFAYRSCKWNTTVEPDNIVIKIRENLEFDREFFEEEMDLDDSDDDKESFETI